MRTVNEELSKGADDKGSGGESKWEYQSKATKQTEAKSQPHYGSYRMKLTKTEIENQSLYFYTQRNYTQSVRRQRLFRTTHIIRFMSIILIG